MIQTTLTGLFKAQNDDARIAELLALLAGRGWLTRAQVSRALGWDERTIRMVAEASNGRVLSGQKGYKLTTDATPEEFSASYGAFRSQARCMLRRAIRTARVWHSAGHR